MDCKTTRVAVSAVLDGEPAGVETTEIELHLDDCPACRAWREAAHDVTRRARLAPAANRQPAPEALERILASAPRSRVRSSEALRGGLVAVAVAQLVITLPLLLLGKHDLQRDMGASDMALFVAFLAVAWRPGRAVAISPVVGTAAGLLILAAVIDLAGGEASLIGEAPHAVAFVGWLLVRQVAHSTPPTIETPKQPLIRSLLHAISKDDQSARVVLATHEPVSPDQTAAERDAPQHERALAERDPAQRRASA
jgi:predicted anti-sigma-YlaC factor YlaD